MKKSLFILLLLSLNIGSLKAQINLDSIWQIIDTIQVDTLKMDYIKGLVYSINDPRTSITLLDQMSESDFYINSSQDKTIYKFCRAEMHIHLGEFEIAKSLLYQCADAWRKNRSYRRIGASYYKLTDIYQMEQNSEKMIETAQESVDYMLLAKDTSWICRSSIKLANCLEVLGQSEKALEKFRDIEPMTRNRPTPRAELFNCMANLYSKINQLDSSLYYQILYRDATLKTDVAANHFVANYNLGLTYQSMDRLQDAKVAFDQCFVDASKSNVSMLLPYALLSKGNVLLQLNKPQEAAQLFDKAEQHKLLADQKQLLAEGRYQLYKKLGQYREALPYLEEWKTLSDSLNKVEITNRINELQIENETAKKQNQINTLSLENEIHTEKVQAQRAKIAGLTIGLIFLGGLLYYALLQRNKVSKQNIIIREALVEKDLLLKEIHHRVKNNLQLVSSLLSLQSRSIKNTHASNALEDGQNRVQSMALIHQHLYTNNNVTAVRMDKYLINLCQTVFDALNIDPEKVHLALEIDDLELDIATVVPLGLICNELITNTCKYAFAGNQEGHIKIILKEQNNILHLSVEDDGVGMEQGQENVGFGTKLINTFSKKLQAEVFIESKNGYKTTLQIHNYKKI